MDDFQGYDASGSKEENITATDLLASISYARTISILPSGNNKLSAGITLKYISEKLEEVNSVGGAADIGLLYEPQPEPAAVPLFSPGSWLKDIPNMWRYAIVVQNIGNGLFFDEEQTPLPTTLRLGMSYHAKYLVLGIESVIPNDNNPYYCFGAEYKINRSISLRIGDSSRQSADNTGLYAGLGVGYFPEKSNEIFSRIQFDYAFSGFNTLGQTHRIGLSIAFSELPARRRKQRKIEEHFNNGTEYYNQGKYNRALSEFNKVLQLDPDNKKTVEMIRKMKK
jgi:tetratricopeptide (TPR) repeat protein